MKGTNVSLLTGLAYFAYAHGRRLVVTVAKVTEQTQHTIRLSLNNFPSITHYVPPTPTSQAGIRINIKYSIFGKPRMA
jgi:hypothetical protein